MLKMQEKNSVVRGIFIIGEGVLVQKDFMKETKKVGDFPFQSGLLFLLVFSFLNFQAINYVSNVKNSSEYTTNPLIVLPLLAGAYGGFLIIKKAFGLAKHFENAE